MPGKAFQALARLGRILPEIRKPARKVSFNEKIFWTILVVLLFLVMSEIPLYGIALTGEDPFRMMRVIMASRRGTLMELGIGPIVTAGLILQLLVGSKIIKLDFSKPEDRSAYTAGNKVLTIVMTGFEAGAYLVGGAYGNISSSIAFLIFLQLMIAGIIVMLLDELVQKGWGLGSGISLFIATGVAQQIYWSCFAPIPNQQDGKYFGALISLFQSLSLNESWDKWFIRPANLPDIMGFTATLVAFIIIVYCEGIRIEIPVAYAKFRGYRGTYPVKLFYVSNIPVILASALFADVFFLSNILWNRANQNNANPWLNWIGMYDPSTSQATGGLAYYLSSPRSLFGTNGVLTDPIRAVVYALIMVGICIVFSITWVEIGGLSAKTVSKQLIDSGMQVPGFRRSGRSIEEILNRYIPVVTVLGGALVGVIAAVSDFFNTFGTGVGILLTTGIMWQYYQLLVKERVEELYPGLSKFMGKG